VSQKGIKKRENTERRVSREKIEITKVKRCFRNPMCIV
jgi:hypothetical protein